MRSRVVLGLSLGANLILAGMIWILSHELGRQNTSLSPETTITSNSPAQIKTNVVIRRKGFQWSEIESTNYPVFIRNLRLIGCPEKTIRDIIVADVNELFAERMRREIVVPEQEWWKPDPYTNALAAAANQMRALYSEKDRMLTELLGPGWNTATTTSSIAEPIRLDGPVLSALSPQVKASLLQIESNSKRVRDSYIQQMRQAGKEPDPVALARMRQEVRQDLATLLTPDQLEEYLLRYSYNSEELREQLRGFGADADEYRRIFRARDTYDAQLAQLTGTDSATEKRRAELERMRDDSVQQAIGAERFKLYSMTQDPSFKEARDTAQENGIAPEKVLPMFQISKATDQEVARIQRDQSLTAEQREAAVKSVLEQKLASIQKVMSGTP